jgi:hypothetical protein
MPHWLLGGTAGMKGTSAPLVFLIAQRVKALSTQPLLTRLAESRVRFSDILSAWASLLTILMMPK